MSEIYLDNAATTPPRPEVVEVMRQQFADNFGNASSTHAAGKRAKRVLEQSRQAIAEALGCEPREVYFTSGGTESNNLAITGAMRARGLQSGQIITSSLEHPSVTRTIRGLRREGAKTVHIEAVHGNFDLQGLEMFLHHPTTLVSIMAVQNELGYRFPIGDIATLRDSLAPDALVHSDLVQAFGKVDTPVCDWSIDLASISAHKIGGPKGIGALYVKRGTHMFTTAFGGGQERGLRSGTEPVYLAAGFAEAVRCAFADRAAEEERVRKLWSHLHGRLVAEVPDFILNSRPDGSPYLFNFAVMGMDNSKALRYLSDQGIYVSKASACSSNVFTVPTGTWRPKHQLSLFAAGVPEVISTSTLRVGFGWNTQTSDVDAFVDCLKAFLAHQ